MSQLVDVLPALTVPSIGKCCVADTSVFKGFKSELSIFYNHGIDHVKSYVKKKKKKKSRLELNFDLGQVKVTF